MSLRLMGKKKGMTRIFNEKGDSIVCTVIQAEPNVVLLVREGEKNGPSAVQLGAEKVPASKLKNVTKPLKGHFAKAQVEPRRHLSESKVPEGKAIQSVRKLEWSTLRIPHMSTSVESQKVRDSKG